MGLALASRYVWRRRLRLADVDPVAVGARLTTAQRESCVRRTPSTDKRGQPRWWATSGGGQVWSPDMGDSESRDAVLAHAGGRLWLSLGPELTALATDTLEPVGRRRLSSDAVGLCADARGVFVLTRDGQVQSLVGP